jgi:hypothetical protein
MHYHAIVASTDPAFIRFPGCGECKLWVPSGKDLRRPVMTKLTEWLEEQLAGGRLPRRQFRPRPLMTGYWLHVPVPPMLAARIQLRDARAQRSLTQRDLGELVGGTQQLVAGYEGPGANPTLGTLTTLAAALHHDVDLTFVPWEWASPRPTARRMASR